MVIIMLSFNFNLPTQIIWGRGCIRAASAETPDKLALGKKAMIVCGRHSAKACGALDDVTDALSAQGVEYVVYDKITENPPVAVCYAGGQLAAESGVDFVIGIGGGSPMDAAKAIAAYAANPELGMNDIFTAKVENVLPIIAIPTTAGTGSEVDPVGVMTLESGKVKKSFKSPSAYPRCAFLDPEYTRSMNRFYTISTALDALCHCVESYLSPKSTEFSRLFALEGAKKIYASLEKIDRLPEDMDCRELPCREELLAGACLGGLAISVTGTGFNHPLGYNLTLYHSVPHGRACAVFMGEYVDYNMRTDEGSKLFDALCAGLGVTVSEFSATVVRWSDVHVKLDSAQVDEYIANVRSAKNYQNSPYVINEAEMREIYSRLK